MKTDTIDISLHRDLPLGNVALEADGITLVTEEWLMGFEPGAAPKARLVTDAGNGRDLRYVATREGYHLYVQPGSRFTCRVYQ